MKLLNLKYTTMKKFMFFLFVSCFLAACGSDDDPIEEVDIVKELVLSAQGVAHIDDVEYEFEILDGNGDYTVSVSDEEKAIATLDGNKVKVSMLFSTVDVTVCDKKGQSATLYISSSAPSLNFPSKYTVIMHKERTLKLDDITFGAGGYTVTKLKGTSADVIINKNDIVEITSKAEGGRSYFKIIDKRGTWMDFSVDVISKYELTSNQLDIKAVNDETITITIKWGEGGWKLSEYPSSSFFYNVVIMKEGHLEGYDILQINTSEDVKGESFVKLEDKAGNIAYVKVTVW